MGILTISLRMTESRLQSVRFSLDLFIASQPPFSQGLLDPERDPSPSARTHVHTAYLCSGPRIGGRKTLLSKSLLRISYASRRAIRAPYGLFFHLQNPEASAAWGCLTCPGTKVYLITHLTLPFLPYPAQTPLDPTGIEILLLS